MSFAPSPQQAAAIAAIVAWYRHRRARQQLFRLSGYAGTSKSTITAAAFSAPGLEPMGRAPGGATSGGVPFAASAAPAPSAGW